MRCGGGGIVTAFPVDLADFDDAFAPRLLRSDNFLFGDAVDALLVQAVLTREGYRHFEALSEPRLAPERHLAFKPDLVLLDLMMPSIDGYALLDSLGRLTGEGDLLPIMVLTADTSIEAKRRALALGARDILAKPFDVFEFALRVANLIELRLKFKQ
jgi:DNA-binding response OmpR family regulator